MEKSPHHDSSLIHRGSECDELTQVEVEHAVGHEDVMEQDQPGVINAFIEPVGSVCPVHVFLCKQQTHSLIIMFHDLK